MSERQWPKDIEPRTKDEWMAAAVSEDPNEMQLIGACLKALKYSARDYVTWSKEQRVDTIVKHQSAGAGSKAKKGAAKPKTKTGGARSRLGGKGKGKAAAKPAAAAAAPSGGGGMSAEQFQELMAAVSAQGEFAEQLSETLGALAEKVEGLESLIIETHYGFMMIALGDETIRENFENADIQEEMLGVPFILTGGDEEEEEGNE